MPQAWPPAPGNKAGKHRDGPLDRWHARAQARRVRKREAGRRHLGAPDPRRTGRGDKDIFHMAAGLYRDPGKNDARGSPYMESGDDESRPCPHTAPHHPGYPFMTPCPGRKPPLRGAAAVTNDAVRSGRYQGRAAKTRTTRAGGWCLACQKKKAKSCAALLSLPRLQRRRLVWPRRRKTCETCEFLFVFSLAKSHVEGGRPRGMG